MLEMLMFYTRVVLFVLFITSFTNCNAQKNKPIIGGPFENGEYMYIDMPDSINAVDTSAAWNQEGQRMLITGTIYKRDGKTFAPNTVLYYYHTDVTGRYRFKEGGNERVRKHGYIRGWVRSDAAGKYAIYTVRPAPYPQHNGPAHIHVSVKESRLTKEYYIDNFVFDDDELLTNAERKAMKNRGGSGVMKLLKQDDLKVAQKDIILGLNIPNYPNQEE